MNITALTEARIKLLIPICKTLNSFYSRDIQEYVMDHCKEIPYSSINYILRCMEYKKIIKNNGKTPQSSRINWVFIEA